MHKKYTHKDGKSYGPYLYETKRVDGKVVTSYLGSNPAKKRSLTLFILVSLVLILGMAFVTFKLFSTNPATGMVALDVNLVYKEGEKLDGDLKFRLKEGELVPRDSKVVISYADQSKTFALSELILDSTSDGSYYAEGTLLSGQGEGYGIKGTTFHYPEIEFTLEVTRDSSDLSDDSESSESVSETPEESSSESSESSESSSETLPEGAQESSETVDETDSTSESESSEESSSESSESSDSGITGSVISEERYTVSGSVSRDADFEFDLADGESARIISDSVTIDGESASASTLNLDQNGNEITVSTDYFISEEGFGEEFIGDYALILEVPIDRLDLTAVPGTIDVALVYNEVSLARLTKDVNVVQSEEVPAETGLAINPITLLKDIPTTRVALGEEVRINLADYFSGAESYSVTASDIDASLDSTTLVLRPAEGFKGSRQVTITAFNGESSLDSNTFLVLVSSGAVSITTVRSKIVVGEPVQWSKSVSLDAPEALAVELPADATNIVVTDTQSGEVINTDNSLGSSLLSGNVVIELDLEKESSLTSWFKELWESVSSLTGLAIDEVPQETLDLALPEASTEYTIEYTTPAPLSVEKAIGVGNKEVTISAADELHYSDVIAFTTLPNERHIRDASRIKVVWELPQEDFVSDSVDSIKEVNDVPEKKVVEESVNDSESGGIIGDVISSDFVDEEKLLDQVTKSEISYEDVRDEASVPFDAYDLDEDGNIDYIEWVVPHLSGQTYDIIISGTQHYDSSLNYLSDQSSEVEAQDSLLTEDIPVGDHLYVAFPEDLTVDSVIKLWANYDTKNGEVSVNISNKDTDFEVASGYVTPGGYVDFPLNTLDHNSSLFDILVTDQSKGSVSLVLDQVIATSSLSENTTSPSINFVSPTPSEGATVNAVAIPINVSTSDSSSRHYVLTDFNRDLRLWLTMDNVNASGDPADSSSWGNNGIRINGAVQQSTGAFGSSFVLNHSNTVKPYIRVPDSVSLDFNNSLQITASAWINRSSVYCYTSLIAGQDTPSNPCTIISKVSLASPSNGWELESSNSNLLLVFRKGGAVVVNTVSPGGLSDGVWTHVAFTFNGTNVAHYINGNLVKNTTAVPYGDTTGPLVVGGRSVDATPWIFNGFNGSIDDVMVFNRSLTPEEMRSLYNATSKQYYHNFTDLSYGAYNVTSYAVNSFGNQASTSRIVTLSSDSTSPSVALTAPDNGSIVTSSSISFNAIFIDDIALTNATFYLWNSSQSIINTTVQNLNGTSGGVNLSVTLPYNGVFKWNYLARDSASNAAYNSTNYTVTYDSIVPSVQITAPTNTSYTSTVTSLIYTATDTNLQSCWYSTNNGATNTSVTCNVGIDVSSSQGTNTWTVYVNDSVGNRNSSSVTFFVDSTLPTVTYVSPAPSNGSSIAGRNLSINVTSTDTNLANSTIYLFNSSRSLINSSFSATSPNYVRFINLSDGIYYFNATARDTSGNLNSTLTRQVTLDSTAPVLTIYAPLNRTYNSTSVPINATSSDSSTPSIGFNIDFFFFDQIYEGATTTTLGQGAHTVNFTSTDLAGNTNSTIVHLSVDSITPTIDFVSPTPSNNTYTSTTSLSVNVTGNESSRGTGLVTLDGINYTMTCTSSAVYYCNYTFNTLSEGAHTYLARMNDSAGNVNSTSLRTITIDSLIPAVQFVGPSTNNNSRLTNRTIIVNTSATDGLLANITTRVYNSTGLFNITTSATSPLHLVLTNLADDTYTFNSTAIDSVGNVNTTETRTVYLDATAPGVSINSPSNSTWSFSTINIVVVLSENGSAQYTLNEGATNYTLSTTNNINFNATNSSIGDGQYTLRVYANDTFGNVNHTVTRTFVIDNSPPVLNITSPLNTTYTSNPILVEYSAVDAIGTILQMEYNTGEGYVSYTKAVNVTVSQGSHTFDFAGVDDSDNTNITSVTFFLDSITPTIDFVSPTPSNNTYINTTSLSVNVTGNESSFNRGILTIDDVNYTMTCSTSAIYYCNYTLTGLNEGVHTYRVSVNDSVGYSNSTELRTITVDSQRPLVSYDLGTENNGEIVSGGAISLVLNLTESNVANVTFNLYNSSGLVNQSISTSSDQDHTFSSVSDGVYTYFASVSDTVGNTNITSNRSIRVISSCLTQCTEGSSCMISNSCMLYSGLCTGNVCDFTNLTLNNATIYTLYESTAGRSLALNVTSNATNALRFILNGSIIFGGKNGSTLGAGSSGGNGGVLNITLAGLFNRTNAQIYGVGGYSTASGSGGNGGILQVMYHGLIGTTSAWTTSFSAGSSVTSSSGTAGSSTLIKDSVCPLDADLSNDGAVGITDVARITTRYGNVTGDSSYESSRDIDCNGELNVIDLSNIGFEYGR